VQDQRNGIIDMIRMLWPEVSANMLMAMFPGVAKREIVSLLTRYWLLMVRRNYVLIHVNRWEKPNTVWAMDFTEPDNPVDGIYPYVLAVRDLASGCNLLWMPVERESAEETVNALKSLFAKYGRPLVIKSDNGSAFKAIKPWLEQEGVWTLFSPPYYPQYNGACEAGFGTLKTYAHHEAAKHGRPHQWTCDDVEAARMRANELSRPHGYLRPTPAEKLSKRIPVTDIERMLFKNTVEEAVCRIKRERGLSENGTLAWCECSGIERRALEKTLAQLGYLSVRRSRITAPIKSRFWRNISCG